MSRDNKKFTKPGTRGTYRQIPPPDEDEPYDQILTEAEAAEATEATEATAEAAAIERIREEEAASKERIREEAAASRNKRNNRKREAAAIERIRASAAAERIRASAAARIQAKNQAKEEARIQAEKEARIQAEKEASIEAAVEARIRAAAAKIQAAEEAAASRIRTAEEAAASRIQAAAEAEAAAAELEIIWVENQDQIEKETRENIKNERLELNAQIEDERRLAIKKVQDLQKAAAAAVESFGYAEKEKENTDKVLRLQRANLKVIKRKRETAEKESGELDLLNKFELFRDKEQKKRDRNKKRSEENIKNLSKEIARKEQRGKQVDYKISENLETEYEIEKSVGDNRTIDLQNTKVLLQKDYDENLEEFYNIKQNIYKENPEVLKVKLNDVTGNLKQIGENLKDVKIELETQKEIDRIKELPQAEKDKILKDNLTEKLLKTATAIKEKSVKGLTAIKEQGIEKGTKVKDFFTKNHQGLLDRGKWKNSTSILIGIFMLSLLVLGGMFADSVRTLGGSNPKWTFSKREIENSKVKNHKNLSKQSAIVFFVFALFLIVLLFINFRKTESKYVDGRGPRDTSGVGNFFKGISKYHEGAWLTISIVFLIGAIACLFVTFSDKDVYEDSYWIYSFVFFSSIFIFLVFWSIGRSQDSPFLNELYHHDGLENLNSQIQKWENNRSDPYLKKNVNDSINKLQGKLKEMEKFSNETTQRMVAKYKKRIDDYKNQIVP